MNSPQEAKPPVTRQCEVAPKYIIPNKCSKNKPVIGEKYEIEAKEKWGNTDAYKEHAEKTKHYSKDKWNHIAEEMNDILAEFAVCMKNGKEPDSAEAQDLVKMLQNHITEIYYHCTNDILAGLGRMYVADERFKNNIDKHGDGTAEFICEAIKIYCGK